MSNEGDLKEASRNKINMPVCPACGGFIPNNETPGKHPGGISRFYPGVEICSACATAEAMIELKAKLKTSQQ